MHMNKLHIFFTVYFSKRWYALFLYFSKRWYSSKKYTCYMGILFSDADPNQLVIQFVRCVKYLSRILPELGF